ncbi:hypothetical protein HPB48_014749 [Haemaphysalis longicornis]|uniref:Uncharacterized protein n=1 Tax=Haemaphysalis longicornis TaxID=44386 RepID=A0A9J6FXQ4_HAELO|nr:hypothetical protein HPB48_014749 [Haemaphysalis longicornis]
MASISETSGRLVERNSQEGQCRECGKPYSGREMMRDGQFFVSLPLQRQLSSQLADKEVASALLDRLNVINQNPGEVESKADITDGDMYRRTRKEISEHDLTLTLNADGAPIFKSSNYSMWPVQVVVNELPRHMRQNNVLVPLLWYGQSRPDMTLLLGSFVKQMDELGLDGVSWTVGTQMIHSKRKYWKATEWQQWLLFFSLPCVVGILPAKYSRHYSLLVRGIALLLKDTVSDDDITESTKCIVRFVVGVQFLYDEAEMTFNMHQLLHLPKSAAMQGPLWAHSCFMFESNIGQVKKLVTSAHGVSQQIVERLMMTANLENLKALASTQTQELLSKSPTTTKQAVVPLGKARPVSAALLAWVHEEMGEIIAGPVVEHDRVAMSGFVFHSEQYKRPYKTDSTVLLMSGTFVKAETLLSATDHFGNKKVFAVSQKYVTKAILKTSHILKCESLGGKKLVEVLPTALPCMFINFGNEMFVTVLMQKVLFASS